MLRVRIQAAANDPALLEGLRISLADELRRVPGMEAVAPEHPAASPAGAAPAGAAPTGAAPTGAKGDAMLLGSLIASGTFSTATLTAATRITLAWLDRAKARKVVITYRGQRLVLEAASASVQRALTEAWLAQVAEVAEAAARSRPPEG